MDAHNPRNILERRLSNCFKIHEVNGILVQEILKETKKVRKMSL